ncbi:hypothetical protein TELCIR_08652 [Teladorsagia circumcincta]|uniref:Uncharacterized protein n=1 Tax=Teladorsagia circumcincta TaxID=45464 RepID=A0A2G9UGZ0_TELCI|nr:hypothetical protein TELCIR_08652 [Teladorsagia circumcincta]
MLAEFLHPVTYRLLSDGVQHPRTPSWMVIFVVDLIAGLVLFSLVNYDGAYDVFWQSVDNLVARLDEASFDYCNTTAERWLLKLDGVAIMDSLTHNPAGLKLNEPVNTALASFFQYHIHLWKKQRVFSKSSLFSTT